MPHFTDAEGPGGGVDAAGYEVPEMSLGAPAGVRDERRQVEIGLFEGERRRKGSSRGKPADRRVVSSIRP